MNPRTLLPKLMLLLMVAAAIGWAAFNQEEIMALDIEARLSALGQWAPLAFAVAFGIATVLFLPGVVFGLTGGALFGPIWGVVWNLVGATIGAGLAFLAARYVFSDWVEAKTSGRMRHLKQGIESEGWRFVAVMRLVPLVPFNALNYALGLTAIPFGQYIAASVVCMLPGAIAYTYLGYVGREALMGSEQLVQKGLLALGLLAITAYIPRFVGRFRKNKTDRDSLHHHPD
uniref:TVP38/TMEM64 family membrane protein n=1 Tax=Candidatus Kentrum sp. MB TaxID=2138164 RepID=A0A450XR49_9GAMM|nr:MAG: Uncharacterized membrane protein YdjX, TVP38/TMEM64 family, SNARE-associated domain [Candidatus Kentron sp. MB]VFK34926.1 MAG: Uncharacterized membrane protein YdjX, TVP38/TMEM64 family, SNARE-associated domain [Candidatus Kentron sp. MB]VFK77043.1 MAG: Uncharacterized membrane protein YdjX, TVP38/TMEM64 family, SNARE-associated domain [Candidatus Kentron sp. MB]